MDYCTILRDMYRSRFFEEKLQEEFSKGTLYGTTHLAIGQEGSHVGLCQGLEDGDWIVPTHRCHGFNVARGSSLYAMFSEMLGSKDGICKGLGGSMHMTDVAHWNLGSSAVVGSGIPLAGGCAYALKRQEKKNIAVAVFGDGASSRGTCHEMMNLASVWKLPLLFFMENNHYGMSASSDRVISTQDIAKRAEGYSMAYSKVEGNDVLRVVEEVKKARAYILETGKPYFLETNTYRMCGHSKSDKLKYRTREEEQLWAEKDPIVAFLRTSGLSSDTVSKLEEEARLEVEEAWKEAWRHKDEVLSVEEAENLVEPEALPVSVTGAVSLHPATYREAIREALDEILSSDRSTLLGEDIGVYGGCFGVTGDLVFKYPEKILETPVSEESFIGLATGAAMLGERPIAEIMYADFMTLASDGVINHGCKAYFMSGGQLQCPMVVRAAMGGGTGHGAQHTQCPENSFLNVPGLKVVAPSDAYSAKALLKGAVQENCPVIFLEHKALYQEEGSCGDSTFSLPLGKALVSGEGKDLLVIGYSKAFADAKKALQDFSCTYLDLATLKPLDEESIIHYAKNFDRILLVQETPLQGSVAETVMRVIYSNCGQKRIAVCGGLDMPLAFTRTIEAATLPSCSRIRETALSLMGDK